MWSLAGRVTAPILDGGRREARIDESLAALLEVRALFASAALRAFFEVENALAAETLLLERLGHLEEAALRSREATALADDQYDQGLVGIDLVLEAQRRELQAESTFLEARRELYQNRVDLHVALGAGSWEERWGPAGEAAPDSIERPRPRGHAERRGPSLARVPSPLGSIPAAAPLEPPTP